MLNKIPSPCFVIEEEKLRNNLQLIKSIGEKADVEFILAYKGFALWKAFPIVKEYINGATASSLFEARLAYEEMNCKPHTYAPVYLENEIDEIAIISSHLTFNSLNQYEKYITRVKKKNAELSIGLRVNPGFSPVETDLYNPASATSRLGISPEILSDALPDGVDGLHFHALCESSSYDLVRVLEHFVARYKKYFGQIKWVNFGGGHLVTRKDYDVNHLIEVLTQFKKEFGLDVILEPGSAFAWQTGFLYSTVQDIIESGGVKTAIVDVSFTAHMPDCLEMPYKPVIRHASDKVDGKPTYRIGGVSCLAGDFIGDWSFDKELKPGDPIIFEDMIHYTMVKTTMFNGVAHPSIAMLKNNGEMEMFRQFNYEDYKNRLC